MKTSPLTLEDVQQAQARTAGQLRVTSCSVSEPLSHAAGMILHLKRDYEQVTGSFKERGALNALLNLESDARVRGVIAASAGNHALGLARHGRRLGIPVTVVMPVHAPRVKAERCREFGAEVVLCGQTYDEAAREAVARARTEGRTFVHPFDDPHVIAGQGTLALEVLTQVAGLDAVVVPVGGGGLLAGVATAVKGLRPEVEVIGVEPAHAAGLAVALAAGRPVRVPVSPTLADGLSVERTGELTYDVARRLVDRVVTVTEEELASALLNLAEVDHTVVEGAGAAGLAACLAGKLAHLRGKRVAVLLTGRNIDPAVHTRALWRARLLREQERTSALAS